MAQHGTRSRARAYGMQVLYAVSLNDRVNPRGALETYRELFELEVDHEALIFATELVMKATEDLTAIDDVIQSLSRNWRLERMNRVDLAILRLATTELRTQTEIPVKVILNEAVELAKRYGATESPAFVNGLLDRIAHEARKA